jgi:MFS family permease
LRVLLAASTLMGFGIGAVEIGLPALAVRSGSHRAAALLLALWSVGSMVGGLLYGVRSWSYPPSVRYPLLLLLVAATTAPLIAAHSLAAGIPLSALAGVGYAPALACEYLLVGKLAPRHAAGEAFMWTTASLITGIAAGSALSGSLVQHVGLGSSFAVGFCGAALAAVVAVAGRGRVEAGDAVPDLDSAS